jgi:hypothetical protein
MQIQEQALLTTREEFIEHPDDLSDGRLDALQSMNDANVRPIITKLPERYDRGEFHPHIHFSIPNGDSGFMTCCGVFANSHQLLEIQLGRLLRSGTDDGQLPMLIKAIHITEGEQGMVRAVPLGDSVVWLQRLDDCVGLVTDSLYFSVEQGQFIGSRRPRVEDWKLNGIGIRGGMSDLPQEFPDEIVKCGAVAVQNFADKGRESGRNNLLTPKILELFNALGIAFHDFAVIPFIQKPIDFDVKVQDILIGPFESFSYPF